MKPRNTAIPPSLGIGTLFTLRALGWSTAPTASANFFACGVIMNAIMNAAATASTIFNQRLRSGNIYTSVYQNGFSTKPIFFATLRIVFLAA